jgi:cell division protein FtsL
MRVLAVALAALLVVAAMSLVTAQHRARGLFVDLERSQQQAKVLDAEGDRLRIELGRLSQPSQVEAGARQLGLRPVDGKTVVFLPAQGAGASTERAVAAGQPAPAAGASSASSPTAPAAPVKK